MTFTKSVSPTQVSGARWRVTRVSRCGRWSSLHGVTIVQPSSPRHRSHLASRGVTWPVTDLNWFNWLVAGWCAGHVAEGEISQLMKLILPWLGAGARTGPGGGVEEEEELQHCDISIVPRGISTYTHTKITKISNSNQVDERKSTHEISSFYDISQSSIV